MFWHFIKKSNAKLYGVFAQKLHLKIFPFMNENEEKKCVVCVYKLQLKVKRHIYRFVDMNCTWNVLPSWMKNEEKICIYRNCSWKSNAICMGLSTWITLESSAFMNVETGFITWCTIECLAQNADAAIVMLLLIEIERKWRTCHNLFLIPSWMWIFAPMNKN